MRCSVFVFMMLVWSVYTASGRAEILAGWDVSGLELDDGTHDPPYTVAADTTATHVAVAEISLSYSVNRSTGADQYGFKISEGNEQSSLGGAIIAGHYMEISLTPDPLYGINLNSIELHGESTSSGCDGVAILSDVDGFSDTAAIAILSGVAGVTGGWDTDESGFGSPIDLSDSRFSELQNVIFRIYGWSSTLGTGVCDLRQLSGYDLIFNGTVEKLPVQGSLMLIK